MGRAADGTPAEFQTEPEGTPASPTEVGGGGLYAYGQKDIGGGLNAGVGFGASSAAEQCPSATGDVSARGTARQRVSFRVPLVHRLTLITDLQTQVTLRSIGHVGDNGKLHDYDVVADAVMTRDGRVLGPAGLVHGDVRHDVQHFRVVLVHIAPGESAYDALGPEHYGYASGDATDLKISAVAGIIIALGHLSDTHKYAEGHYYRDAGCLTGEGSPKSMTLEPGHSKPATIAVHAKVDGAPVSMDLQVSEPTQVLGVTPSRLHVAASAPGRLTIRAGDHEGTYRIYAEGGSRRGRVRIDPIDTTVKRPDEQPYHYRIMSASFSTHAIGHIANSYDRCSSAGFPVGGTTDFGGEVSNSTFDPNNSLQASPSGLIGALGVRIPAQWARTLDGCTVDDRGDKAPCHLSPAAESPQPDGNSTIGVAIDAVAVNSVTAHLRWSLPDPEVGYASGGHGNEICNSLDISQTIPLTEHEDTIPLATLQSETPQTLTFSGDRHWDHNQIGQPINLSYTWSITLRIQPVDATGAPLAR